MTTNSKTKVERGDGWFQLTVFVPAKPASRPRVGRYGTYYSKTYKAYRALMKEAIPTSTEEPLDGDLHADVEFVVQKPKTTKRVRPGGDIDNYEKAIYDAVTGEKDDLKLYWHDDEQLVTVEAEKRWAKPDEEPHTRIRVTQV